MILELFLVAFLIFLLIFLKCFGCKRRYVCQILGQFPIWEAKSIFFAFKFGFLMIFKHFFAILVYFFIFGLQNKICLSNIEAASKLGSQISCFFCLQIWFSIGFKAFFVILVYFFLIFFVCKRKYIYQILRQLPSWEAKSLFFSRSNLVFH